jgi:hypothetical protein
MGRTVGIHRFAGRSNQWEAGPWPVLSIASTSVSASVAPAGMEWAEGRRVKPPPLWQSTPALPVMK